MDYSTTAINQVNKKSPTEAIIFSNLICPHCGNLMDLYHTTIRGYMIPIRYECGTCKYCCPIYHDTENQLLRPSYDKGVYNFLSTFGEDIHDRINDIGRKIL